MESKGPIVSDAAPSRGTAADAPGEMTSRPGANVARVLHDDLQQQLHAIGLQLALAAEHVDAGELDHLRTRLDLARRWLHDSIGTVRWLCAGVAPAERGRTDLALAVRSAVAEVSDRFGLRVDVRIDPSAVAGPAAVWALADAARELLFNVVKHAGCDVASVELRDVAGVIELVVADRGGGSAPHDQSVGPESAASGTGLARVRRAVGVCGGTVAIGPDAAGGCTVVVRLPALTSVDRG